MLIKKWSKSTNDHSHSKAISRRGHKVRECLHAYHPPQAENIKQSSMHDTKVMADVRKSKKTCYKKRAQRVVELWQCRSGGSSTSREGRICRHKLYALWLDRRQLRRAVNWATEQVGSVSCTIESYLKDLMQGLGTATFHSGRTFIRGMQVY